MVERHADARTAIVSGLTLGVVGGFLLLEAPPFGLAVAIGGAVLMRAYAQTLRGSGALLAGIGCVWLILLGRVKLECIGDPAVSCPSIDLYLVLGGVFLASGAGLALAGTLRDRSGGRPRLP